MKKLISIILAISIICGFTVSVTAVSGEGTQLNPYMISTPADLMAISDDLSAHYKLANDIDMSDIYDYKPIGNATDGAFTGSLDGNGFTISNLNIELPGEKYTGLFGYSEGDISNLTLSNVYIIGGRYVGGIAGYSGTKGTINFCSVNGLIYSENPIIESCVGGIAGYYNGVINKCFSEVNITTAGVDIDGFETYLGGIVGRIMGDIIESSSSGKLTVKNEFISYNTIRAYANVGGLAGFLEGSITCCNSTVQITNSFTGNSLTYQYVNAGGLVGDCESGSQIKESVFNGKVKVLGSTNCVGGLIGLTGETMIKDCLNNGDLSGKCVGGLIGSGGDISIIRCYNIGLVNATIEGGGLVGVVRDVSIDNSQNSGNVSVENIGYAGGLIGKANTAIINESSNVGSVYIVDYRGLNVGGGFIAYAKNVTLNSCFNSGHIRLNGKIGGFVGEIYQYETFNATNCYNIGYVEELSGYYLRDQRAGTFAGQAYGVDASLVNCYNAGKISSDGSIYGFIESSSYSNFDNVYFLKSSIDEKGQGVGLSGAEMKNQSNFGWDFVSTWYIDPNMNNGYPMLSCFTEEQYAMDISYSDLEPGEVIILTPYFNGDPIEAVSWTSSDSSIVGVSSDGTVTAKDAGIVTITAKTSEGYKINSCISVIKSCGGITITDQKVNKNSYITVTAALNDSSSNETITDWQSSDPSIATVSANGTLSAEVIGVNIGTCEITATSVLGETATFTVTVTSNATSISLSSASTTVNRGKTKTLTPTVTPSPTQSTLSWSSSDESIATVDQNGIVTGVSCGQAVITVQTDNGYSATCTVTVKAPTETLTMERASITVTKGFTDKVVAVPDPLDTTDTITYSTSSSSYVSVNSSTGVITGNRVGTATITATASSGVKAYCTITVLEVETPVTGITLDRDEINIHGGELVTLSPTVLPATATNKQLIWSVEDSTIATVNQTGVVKGVGTGTTVVTATTAEGGYSISCTVNVVIDVTNVKLDADHLDMNTDETAQLTATVLPENATNKNVKWTSSAENIATVDENGVVTAVSQGVAIITVTTDDWNKSATCFVTVTEPVDSIVLSSTSASVVLNETLALTASLVPADATYPDIVWTSSDETVATVDENGIITANKLGIATITATAHNGITSECEIYVVSFEGAEYTEFASQKTEDGTAVIINEYCGTSSEVIIPRAIGGLPVTTLSSNLFANCEQTIETLTIPETVTEIEVGSFDSTIGIILCYENSAAHVYADANGLNYELIFEMTLSTRSATLYKGDDMQLSLSITPSTMANSAITWTSSNTAVAYVDENGNISAKKQGSAVITATDELGNKITCTIRVIPRTPTIMIYNFDHSYEYKVDWWKPYSSAKMRLGRYSYNCEDAVRYEWTSSNSRVKIDQDGNITNTGFFGRSSTITVKAYDAEGNVLASKSVKVVFYKFKWQRDKLQTQSIVSDNYIDRNVPEETLDKTTENESVAILSYFIEYMEKILKSLFFLM